MLSSHDLKWNILVGFAAVSLPVRSFQNAAIGDVFKNFTSNLQRIKWMILAPSLVGDLTIQIQRKFDIAELQITGELPGTFDVSEHPRYAEIADLAQRFFHLDTQEIFDAIGTPQYEEFVLKAIEQGTQPVLMLSGQGAPARAGIEAMLFASVTATWTAIETMAVDLWVTSLNIHPQVLAELNGKRKRFLYGDEPENENEQISSEDNSRIVKLAHLIRHQFNIHDKMGEVLRGHQRFDNLGGIREAYGLAFKKDTDNIGTYLKDRSLDELSSIRNLIVHRAGVADESYQRQTKYLNTPRANVGEQILLDGEIVTHLINKASIAGMNLIITVDDWLSRN